MPFNYSLNNISMDLLTEFERLQASDMHISYGYPPFCRINGELKPLNNVALTQEAVKTFITQIVEGDILLKLSEREEIDMSFKYKLRGKEKRYRVSIALSEKRPYVVLRRLNIIDKKPWDIGVPDIFLTLAKHHSHGVVFVTGTTGSGKSTVLASTLSWLLETNAARVLTLEDPIEYAIPPGIGVVSQREIGWDTKTFATALKSAMRQDPDIIFVGEVRDMETAEALLAAAETGHLVFATLHVGSVSLIPDRIEGFFQGESKDAVNQRLMNVFAGAMSQTLLPVKSGNGRVLGWEFIELNRDAVSLFKQRKLAEIRDMMSWKRTRMADTVIRLTAAGLLDAVQAKHHVNFPEEWDDVYLNDKIKEYIENGLPEDLLRIVNNFTMIVNNKTNDVNLSETKQSDKTKQNNIGGGKFW